MIIAAAPYSSMALLDASLGLPKRSLSGMAYRCSSHQPRRAALAGRYQFQTTAWKDHRAPYVPHYPLPLPKSSTDLSLPYTPSLVPRRAEWQESLSPARVDGPLLRG